MLNDLKEMLEAILIAQDGEIEWAKEHNEVYLLEYHYGYKDAVNRVIGMIDEMVKIEEEVKNEGAEDNSGQG